MSRNLADFDELILYNSRRSNLSVRLWATLSEGCLIIAGQDLGSGASIISDDYEYEYFYGFDEQNTTRLFALIADENKSIQAALLQSFGGAKGEEKLRKLCETNGIEYSFHSC